MRELGRRGRAVAPVAQGVPGHKTGFGSLLRTSAVSACHADRLVPLTTPTVTAAVMTMMVQPIHRRAYSLRIAWVRNLPCLLRDIAALASSASLRSSSTPPFRVRVAECGLRPSPASASRRALASAPPLAPPEACSARPPSVPPALTATQSPWWLPCARFARVDSPWLIPWICRS